MPRCLVVLSSGLAALVLAMAPGCAPAGPHCSAVIDITGRFVAACGNPRADPICDETGETGRYENTPTMGIQLVGAVVINTCTLNDEVVCPTGTEGEPYCLVDPRL